MKAATNPRPPGVCSKSPSLRPFAAVVGFTAMLITAGSLHAQPISVPNHSFELDAAPNFYPFANTNIASWQKIPEPAYYLPAIGSFPPWNGTAGVFLDVNPYVNRVGNQAGYILAFPQVTLFQDYDSSPTHDFDATFEIGKSYHLTVGIFGKDTIAPGSTLELSLYYRDNLDNKVTVGSTTVTYSAAAFPSAGPLALVDYEVNAPTVLAEHAWAGQHIGIQFESTIGLALATGGNWDFDNVRLTAVPEPGIMSLLALGSVGWLWGRIRVRGRA